VRLRTWTFLMVAAVAMICGSGAAAVAQDQTPTQVPPPAAKSGPLVVPLKVQVVLSKYQGDKKVSTMPYTLSLATSRARVSLRMGGEIPLATTTFNSTTVPSVVSVNYRSVGTSIDCSAEALDDGRYALSIGLEDSSVYSEDQEVRKLSKATTDQPSFNTFKVNEAVILRDGESSQFTAATDKITGQVIKVDVTLTVLK
jgi:hypothetical protein